MNLSAIYETGFDSIRNNLSVTFAFFESFPCRQHSHMFIDHGVIGYIYRNFQSYKKQKNKDHV